MRRIGKRRSGPWYGEERERVFFELNAFRYFPTLQRQYTRLDSEGPGCLYCVRIEVPFYETRHIQIFFVAYGTGDVPIILADGPTESPHRFSDFDRKRLCIWYQEDPRDLRWTRQDGLVHLLGLIRAHLFREAWWRDTGYGEWLGPQAPHNAADATREIDR